MSSFEGWRFLRAEGFFYSLNVLYGGLGINVFHFLWKKIRFQLVKFYKLWSSNPWIRIQARMETNADPQHFFFVILILVGLQENAGNIATLLYDAMGDVDQKSVGRYTMTVKNKIGKLCNLQYIIPFVSHPCFLSSL